MKLTKALRTGSFGVQLELPAGWTVVSETDEAVQLVDEERGAQWWWFWFPGTEMVIGKEVEADLSDAMKHYARAMFDFMFEKKAAESGNPAGGEHKPRTADAEWTPMVDFEHVTVDGAAALRTVHRMTYQPGSEIVMGHLLVPLKGGLFEARLVAGDGMTGMRESLLLAKQGDLEKGIKTLRQADYDDPARDADFPDHALSRTRAALRWAMNDAGLRVLEPAAAAKGGEVELSKLECALVPPLRFVRSTELDDHNIAGFERISFCGTDGVERLLVQRVEELGKLAPAKLRDRAEVFTHELHEGSGMRSPKLAVEELSIGGRSHVLIVVEGTGKAGAVRNSLCWFLDDRGRAWFLGITASDAVPREARVAELRAAAASWRSTAPAKPWWKLW